MTTQPKAQTCVHGTDKNHIPGTVSWPSLLPRMDWKCSCPDYLQEVSFRNLRPLWILYLAPLSWSLSHCRNFFVSNCSIFLEISKIFQSCVLPPGHAGAFHQDHCQMVRHVLEMPKSHEVFKRTEERFYPYTQAVGNNKTNHLILMAALSQ